MGRAKAVNCPVNEARAEEATGAELGAGGADQEVEGESCTWYIRRWVGTNPCDGESLLKMTPTLTRLKYARSPSASPARRDVSVVTCAWRYISCALGG